MPASWTRAGKGALIGINPGVAVSRGTAPRATHTCPKNSLPPFTGGEDDPLARYCRADHPGARRAAPGRTNRSLPRRFTPSPWTGEDRGGG